MNLEKLKDTARKFEQKEEWRKALDVYLKAIQQVESSNETTPDISLFNRVGDLHMKVNDTAAAVRSYERAVDLYADQGFFNNAIALCGKILRVNPGRTEVYLKLAQLHARKNVVIEAKRNLLEYLERKNAVGQLETAFAEVKRFADQFSGNPEIRMMLVDLLRASSRAGEAKEQLEKLEVVLEATGDENNARKTRAALEEIEHSPAGGSRRGDLIFLDTGVGAPAASAAPQAPPAAPQPPAAADRADFAMLDLEPGPAAGASPAAPEPLAGLERSAPADDFAADPSAPGDVSFVLERSEPMDFSAAFEETSSAEEYGTIDPTSFEPAVAPLDGLDRPEGLRLDTPAFEPERRELADVDFGGMRLDALEEAKLERAEGAEDDAVESLGLEGALGADLAFSADSPAEPAVDADAVELDFLPADPTADLGAGDGPIQRASDLSFIHGAGPADAGGATASLEERVLEDPDDPDAHRDLAEQLAAEGDMARAAEELGIALDRLQEREAWADALATVRRLAQVAPAEVGTYQKWVELAYRSGERGPLVEAYLALAGALVRGGAADKAIAVYQRVVEHDPRNAVALRALEALVPAPRPAPAPPSPKPAPAPAPPKPPPKPAASAASSDDFVDLGSMVIDAEAPRDTRMRVERSDPKHDDEEREFREILAEFKRGIDQNLATDDYQAHYDLGVAFREMGLLDEAIAEFQKALGSPDGRLSTSEALGMAFFDKGQFAIAESVLRRAVDGLPGSDDEKIGLIYWLGRASEAQGKATEALASYQRALAVDIRFQDAGERLNRLTAERRS